MMKDVHVKLNAGLPMTKTAFNKNALFTSKMDLNLRKKLVKCYIWSIALYGVETWTLQKVDQKYLQRTEMWCWRQKERMSWTSSVRNEVLHRVKEERNILQTIIRRKDNWIGHTMHGNCLLKQISKRKIEGFDVQVTVHCDKFL